MRRPHHFRAARHLLTMRIKSGTVIIILLVVIIYLMVR